MKIRSGFVSNSSSSSFCILGTSDKKICQAIQEKLGMPQNQDAFFEWMSENGGGRYFGSVSHGDLEMITDPWGDDRKIMYVGMPLGDGDEVDLPDDTTHMKNDVAAKIAKLSGKNVGNIKLIFGESSNGS